MRTMEQHNDNSGGVYWTILLTVFTWFMNFVNHADLLLQLMLHTAQLIAAIVAILLGLSTLMPSFKVKLVKFLKGFM